MDADSLDVLSAVTSPAASNLFCPHLQHAPREIWNLLAEYLDVLSSDCFLASTPKHGVFHDLPTDSGPPVFAKACHLDPEKLGSTKAEFLKMEKEVIVRHFLLLGPVLSTWFLNLMVPGDPVVISDASTLPLFLTDILCLLLQISPPG